MDSSLTVIVNLIISIFGPFLVALVTYQYIEVGKKRKIDTYWKIETEYKSEGQQNARKAIEFVEEDFLKLESILTASFSRQEVDQQLVDFYNAEYHYSSDPSKRELAWTIRSRIRFLNQIGVLLKKKMVDKDLLFSLIGLGFEIDYRTLTIILQAHRKSHNSPLLYNYFEYLWIEYYKWKERQR